MDSLVHWLLIVSSEAGLLLLQNFDRERLVAAASVLVGQTLQVTLQTLVILFALVDLLLLLLLNVMILVLIVRRHRLFLMVKLRLIFGRFIEAWRSVCRPGALIAVLTVLTGYLLDLLIKHRGFIRNRGDLKNQLFILLSVIWL